MWKPGWISVLFLLVVESSYGEPSLKEHSLTFRFNVHKNTLFTANLVKLWRKYPKYLSRSVRVVAHDLKKKPIPKPLWSWTYPVEGSPFRLRITDIVAYNDGIALAFEREEQQQRTAVIVVLDPQGKEKKTLKRTLLEGERLHCLLADPEYGVLFVLSQVKEKDSNELQIVGDHLKIMQIRDTHTHEMASVDLESRLTQLSISTLQRTNGTWRIFGSTVRDDGDLSKRANLPIVEIPGIKKGTRFFSPLGSFESHLLHIHGNRHQWKQQRVPLGRTPTVYTSLQPLEIENGVVLNFGEMKRIGGYEIPASETILATNFGSDEIYHTQFNEAIRGIGLYFLGEQKDIQELPNGNYLFMGRRLEKKGIDSNVHFLELDSKGRKIRNFTLPSASCERHLEQ